MKLPLKPSAGDDSTATDADGRLVLYCYDVADRADIVAAVNAHPGLVATCRRAMDLCETAGPDICADPNHDVALAAGLELLRRHCVAALATAEPPAPAADTLPGNDVPRAEALANARLIAAAPIMLAALRQCEDRLSRSSNAADWPALDAARDALALAQPPKE